uniref:NADH-ubiquinone oxidoreductase chain 4 n=1 Tax=Hoplobatrachus tigerinus TaxID=103373 RepID=E1NZ24_HOPTI|nr:NADH dehydrogenase subunit 4 [Hoplobatrachus tigerinus]BAJ21251.1 NADH dehydrogenase subunit 4 [Hoplobatrachus tigerinus]
MLMITLAWFTTLVTSMFVHPKHLWSVISAQGFFIAILSVFWFLQQDFYYLDSFFLIDNISGPLALLTCWVFPLTMLASQSKLSLEPINRQRSYIINSSYLQLTTLLAFTTSDLMLFFVFFEASLIPTLIVITRWGAQERRLEAGLYIALYTMAGAIPLMLWLTFSFTSYGTLFLTLIPLTSLPQQFSHPALFWFLCNLAFLVKLPLYSLHLWLPKAHVEAPIAGSMILAGTLLKLGGYGMLRFSPLLSSTCLDSLMLLLLLSIFGILATAMLCLRQTDLKSLVALSSVGHMNLVVVATLINTPTSHTGAMIMMIAHGLTSPAMFALVNTAYERTNSRAMLFLRGSAMILPLASAWWLTATLANMAIPPSPNFISELLIFSSLAHWSPAILLIVLLSLLFTTGYSLYVLWTTQRGSIPNHLNMYFPFQTREHILLALHMLPLLLLILKPGIIM